MNRLIYFATNGLGECICQSPAIRQLAKDNDVLVVAPPNIVPYFCSIPSVKEVMDRTTVKFRDYGDGSFSCDPDLMNIGHGWTSPHYNEWVDIKERFTRKGSGQSDYVTGYCNAILGPQATKEMKEQDFFLEAPEVEPITKAPDVVLFQGSLERLRRLPDEYLVKLYSKLRGRGFTVSLFTATGNRGGEDDFKCIANHIGNAKLVITPDSGPFHLSLALKTKTLFLPTREHWSYSYHPVYQGIVYTWMKQKGMSCDQSCRGRVLHKQLPQNYPVNMACWGKTCDGFKWTDDDVMDVANYATSILDGKLVDKALFYPNLLDEESSPSEGPRLEPSLALSHNIDNSTPALATPV